MARAVPVEGVAAQDHDQATNGKQLGHALTDRATPVSGWWCSSSCPCTTPSPVPAPAPVPVRHPISRLFSLALFMPRRVALKGSIGGTSATCQRTVIFARLPQFSLFGVLYNSFSRNYDTKHNQPHTQGVREREREGEIPMPSLLAALPTCSRVPLTHN